MENSITKMKNEIKVCIEEIESICSKEKSILTEADKNFFSFILRKILFYKKICKYWSNQKHLFSFKVIVSDLFSLIFTIIEKKERYCFLNERSIIENFTRILVSISIAEDYVTKNVLDKLKKETTNKEFSFINNEYINSCGYVHGSDILNGTLISFFSNNLSEKNTKIFNSTKKKCVFFLRIEKLLNIYEKLLICKFSDKIDGIFFKEKDVFEYMTSKKHLELLFSLIK
jgi:hypothetical protein|nr:MAG TPA: hypothetical protein [Caudoviricetes sp.]